MAGRVAPATPSLITSARFGTSLSTDQRTKRYLITMAFRVVCFLAAVVAPLPWNVVLLVAAALLPGIAVLLGNARDNRPATPVAFEADDEAPQLAITAGEVIKGDVEQEDDR